jgi:hypothetical protein
MFAESIIKSNTDKVLVDPAIHSAREGILERHDFTTPAHLLKHLDKNWIRGDQASLAVRRPEAILCGPDSMNRENA